MNCPRCNTDSLRPETYEGVDLHVCSKCKGTWASDKALAHIVTTKDTKFSRDVVAKAVHTAFAGVPKAEQQSIEKCPSCALAMQAVNYSYDSGVIVDRCPSGHGIWLDGGELERVQAYAEEWRTRAEQHSAEWQELVQKVATAQKADDDRQRQISQRSTKFLLGSLIHRIIGR